LTAQSLALRSWVDGRQFPKDAFFETIDTCKTLLASKHKPADGDDPPSDHALAIMLAGTLDEQGQLLAYALERQTVAFKDEQEWLKVCLAAAWVVLQVYEKACKDGSWQPSP
jgi:hypothetical protein